MSSAKSTQFDAMCAEVDDYEPLPSADPGADMFSVAPAEERIVYLDEDSIHALSNPLAFADFTP